MIDDVDIAANLPYKLVPRMSINNHAILVLNFESHHGLNDDNNI